MIGQLISHYRIVAKLGSGGMGVVYEAEDTRLGRRVALKLLPEDVACDAEALERFRREARAASSLNHPHICTVHDVGEHEGRPFIVMERVEGRTLKEIQGGKPLPMARTLDLGMQIADALEVSHGKGIVHRDVKPTNVLVAESGRAKVMDFGLAKLMRSHPQAVDSKVETAIRPRDSITGTGVAVGTVVYMSPEQARGEQADNRSDLFSLGVVLYEMSTGRLPFAGKTTAVVFEAILTKDPPPLITFNPSTPSELQRIISKALDKDPETRYQTAADLRADLLRLKRRIESGRWPADRASGPPVRRMRASRGSLVLASGALVMGLLAGYLLHGARERSGRAGVVTVHRLTDYEGIEEFPAISPDGRSIAFSADIGGSRHIWVRLIAGGRPLRITSEPGDHVRPRWAPDSATLVYFSPAAEDETQGTLWEVSSLGGTPRPLGASVGSGDISPDGRTIAFFRAVDGQVELIVSSRDGSEARSLLQLPTGGREYLSPRWSPDQRWIAFIRVGGTVNFESELLAVPAEGGELRPIDRDVNFLRGFAWLPDGSGILKSSPRGSTFPYLPPVNLWTVGVDAGELRKITFGNSSYLEPDVSPSGAVVAGLRTMDFDIWKFPVNGTGEENVRRAVRITRQTGRVATPSPAPDDSELVYLSDSGGHTNLWITTEDGRERRQITFEKDPSTVLAIPRWSPDGSRIVFPKVNTRGAAPVGQWLVNPDGTQLRLLVHGGWSEWSPDGRWLYYVTSNQGVFHIEKIPTDGGEPVTVRTDNAIAPVVPPGEDALYYVVQRHAGLEIRVARPEDGPSELLYRVPPFRVAPEERANFQPSISPDGSTLAMFLRDGHTTNLFALPTSGGPLRRLTDFGERRVFIVRRVSWSSDGNHLYAAIGEAAQDVVLLDGLVPPAVDLGRSEAGRLR